MKYETKCDIYVDHCVIYVCYMLNMYLEFNSSPILGEVKLIALT